MPILTDILGRRISEADVARDINEIPARDREIKDVLSAMGAARARYGNDASIDATIRAANAAAVALSDLDDVLGPAWAQLRNDPTWRGGGNFSSPGLGFIPLVALAIIAAAAVLAVAAIVAGNSGPAWIAAKAQADTMREAMRARVAEFQATHDPSILPSAPQPGAPANPNAAADAAKAGFNFLTIGALVLGAFLVLNRRSKAA